MGTLRIERPKEYINKFRNYIIILDGKKVGKIAEGEVKEFDVSPGRHSLKFAIDWTSSKEEEFTILEEDIKVYGVSGFKAAKWMMPLALGLIIIGTALDFLLGFDPFIYFVAVIFFVLVYYVSFGRTQYLRIVQHSPDLPHS